MPQRPLSPIAVVEHATPIPQLRWRRHREACINRQHKRHRQSRVGSQEIALPELSASLADDTREPCSSSQEHEDGYRISRDPPESRRLNLQHKIYIHNLGYLIHPAIAARLPTPARFADVGTGTGIFLSDLARCLPVNCRLEGFDISDAQFPSLQSLPANICLDILDAKQPFPQHLHHRYDLVCLRLLVAAVEKYEWEGITRNVRELLRPGGAIQWVEADHSQMFLSPFQGTPSATTESLQKWGTRICYGPMGDRLKYGWSTLPAIFRKLGLEDIVSEAISSDRTAKTRQDGTDVQIAVCRSIANHPRHVEGLGGRREVDRMIAEMKADQASGAFLRWTIHVAFGFKPTTEDTVPSTSRKQACLSHLSSDDRSVSRIGHYEDGYLLQIPRGSFRSLSEESSLR